MRNFDVQGVLLNVSAGSTNHMTPIELIFFEVLRSTAQNSMRESDGTEVTSGSFHAAEVPSLPQNRAYQKEAQSLGLDSDSPAASDYAGGGFRGRCDGVRSGRGWMARGFPTVTSLFVLFRNVRPCSFLIHGFLVIFLGYILKPRSWV